MKNFYIELIAGFETIKAESAVEAAHLFIEKFPGLRGAFTVHGPGDSVNTFLVNCHGELVRYHG
jgi:hypothetical protein